MAVCIEEYKFRLVDQSRLQSSAYVTVVRLCAQCISAVNVWLHVIHYTSYIACCVVALNYCNRLNLHFSQLPTSLVVQVQQSVRYVCVCVSAGQWWFWGLHLGGSGGHNFGSGTDLHFSTHLLYVTNGLCFKIWRFSKYLQQVARFIWDFWGHRGAEFLLGPSPLRTAPAAGQLTYELYMWALT